MMLQTNFTFNKKDKKDDFFPDDLVAPVFIEVEFIYHYTAETKQFFKLTTRYPSPAFKLSDIMQISKQITDYFLFMIPV